MTERGRRSLHDETTLEMCLSLSFDICLIRLAIGTTERLTPFSCTSRSFGDDRRVAMGGLAGLRAHRINSLPAMQNWNGSG